MASHSYLPQNGRIAHAQLLSSGIFLVSEPQPTSSVQSPSQAPAPNGQLVPYEHDISNVRRGSSQLPSPPKGGTARSPSISKPMKLRLISQESDRMPVSAQPNSVKNRGDDGYSQAMPSPSDSLGTGLKLRLRGIQGTLRNQRSLAEILIDESEALPPRKRKPFQVFFDDDTDTDSEIDIIPPSKKIVKPIVNEQKVQKYSRCMKKVKGSQQDKAFDGEDSLLDTDDVETSLTSPHSKLVLLSNVLKRSERMLDPNNPKDVKLIAAAPKAGVDYYDSDADELPGNVKDTSKPHLFRNVRWGSLATDYTQPSNFPTEPEFSQFVPGRFERLPDGTAADQKHKLIVKLTDRQNRRRIFLNPPPRDWTNQEAITALNKRTVQQIRRNTSVRFREVVEPYVKEEREWIAANLSEGKPNGGWKPFVAAFNRKFAGKHVGTGRDRRPERSHSSLTKEVERFGDLYVSGAVPTTAVRDKCSRKRRARKTD